MRISVEKDKVTESMMSDDSGYSFASFEGVAQKIRKKSAKGKRQDTSDFGLSQLFDLSNFNKQDSAISQLQDPVETDDISFAIRQLFDSSKADRQHSVTSQDSSKTDETDFGISQLFDQQALAPSKFKDSPITDQSDSMNQLGSSVEADENDGRKKAFNIVIVDSEKDISFDKDWDSLLNFSDGHDYEDMEQKGVVKVEYYIPPAMKGKPLKDLLVGDLKQHYFVALDPESSVKKRKRTRMECFCYRFLLPFILICTLLTLIVWTKYDEMILDPKDPCHAKAIEGFFTGMDCHFTVGQNKVNKTCGIFDAFAKRCPK